jgi:uncharacterized membrane protein
MKRSAPAQIDFATLLATIKHDRKPRSETMKNISMKQTITAAAAMSAVAVFGLLSFGDTAKAATPKCYFWNGVLGQNCCERLLGSQVINVSASCHDRIVHKRKLRRPNDPALVLIPLEKEWVEGSRGGEKDKGPNDLK